MEGAKRKAGPAEDNEQLASKIFEINTLLILIILMKIDLERAKHGDGRRIAGTGS
jgi:hypothetical protein